MDNFHPYDGTTRRFHHTDDSREVGLRAVASVLRLPHPPAEEGLLYDLSFYSGGIGVLDELAISLPADSERVEKLVSALNARPLETLWNDAVFGDDIRWLLTTQEGHEPAPPTRHAEAFINSQRRAFQPPCSSASQVWLDESSNVNDWAILWVNEGRVNFLGYAQG